MLCRGTSSAPLGNHPPGSQTEQGLSRPLTFLSPSTWRPHTVPGPAELGRRNAGASGAGRSDFCSTADHVMGMWGVSWAFFSCENRAAVPPQRAASTVRWSTWGLMA